MYWYNDNSADRSVIVSTRVRLARNFADYPFEPRLDETGAKEITEKVKNALPESEGYKWTDFSALDENAKISMVEKHLVSPEFAAKKAKTAIAENEQTGISVMVLEEDHIRIQCIKAGLDPEGALKECLETDDLIDSCSKIAFDEKLGYLTHCPTNLGTGMRVSVMMFLPALTATGKIKGLSHQLAALGLTVRGITGEGSTAKGCLYQFSNRTSLGMSEEEIIVNLKEAVQKICDTEQKLRSELERQNGIALCDRVMRSLGTMKYARILSSEEMYRLYSDVRLGISLGLTDVMTLTELDSLLISVMPATLSMTSEGAMDPINRDIARADMVREALAK